MFLSTGHATTINQNFFLQLFFDMRHYNNNNNNDNNNNNNDNNNNNNQKKKKLPPPPPTATKRTYRIGYFGIHADLRVKTNKNCKGRQILRP